MREKLQIYYRINCYDNTKISRLERFTLNGKDTSLNELIKSAGIPAIQDLKNRHDIEYIEECW